MFKNGTLNLFKSGTAMELQTHLATDWLRSSWSRSSDAGLTERRKPEDIHVSGVLLKERQYKATQLIEAVERSALPLFNQVLARSDSRLILSDVEGVIIASWGQEHFREKLTTIALSSGACWQEKLKGTNAIGTALVEKKAVSVIGDQHYIRHHRFISCSASPLCDHQGKLLGVLDITTEQSKHDTAVQLLVQNMVQLVENHLLSQVPKGAIRLDLAMDKSVLHTGWQGIVIADEQGQILAHNQVASQLLAQGQLVGSSIEQLHSHRNSLVMEKRFLIQAKKRRRTVSASCELHMGDHRVETAWQQANKVIGKDIPLLIEGETGVGKSEFVKALHRHGERKSGALVTVNCGALPKDLIESELFGYVAGAFTGANPKGNIGKVRQAHGGILFLDEIGEMPLEAQVRLLHVLQDKQVVPVGATSSFDVDLQIIAATHQNLRLLVEKGEFRQDLYYRLNGLLVQLPPLRERDDRREMIKRIHQKYHSSDQSLCPHLLRSLDQYHWPGNFRELDNLLKVATLIASEEKILSLAHLPAHLMDELVKNKKVASQDMPNLKSAVDDALVRTYQAQKGNISKTSRVLGVSRNTIYRKLKAMGIL